MNEKPNCLIIDLSALTYNFKQVRKLVGNAKIMGVVKSDAYGHGSLPISKTLEKIGADRLGVAHLHEATELRQKGIKLPIVVLCGIRSREDSREIVERNLIPTLFDMDAAEILAEEVSRSGRKIPVQIKVDTGMGRLGVSCADLKDFVKKILSFQCLVPEGIASHLSSADDSDTIYTDKQIRCFREAIEAVQDMGLDLPMNNLANSAGVMRFKGSHFDMVRPGIMLYGGLPSPDFKTHVHLKPVMQFKGSVLQIRDLPDNTPISYGRTYYTDGPRSVAVLSAGYGDGLPRSISNTGHVIVREKKAKILGTVCMNMTVSDVSHLEDVRKGDEVMFLGEGKGVTVAGDDIARWAGTVSYEIFCSIGQRNTKEFLE